MAAGVVLLVLVAVLSRPAAVQKLGVRRDVARPEPEEPRRPTSTRLPPVSSDNEAEPICGNCTFWTRWINADQSSTDGGDFESLGYDRADEGGRAGRVTRFLARRGIVCNTPLRVQCRGARSQETWFDVGDNANFTKRLNCQTDNGFICRNSEQIDVTCQDYEIRLLCWRECDRLRWSDWFDKDNPSGKGDYEIPGRQDSWVRHAEPCADGGSPYEIDCQTLSGDHAAIAPNRRLRCSVNNGFSCVNEQQSGGTTCKDYRVRYLCGDDMA